MDRPLYIFDLDGTLADITHRLHFIQKTPKDWDGFFAACVDDAPIRSTIHLFDSLYCSERPTDLWIWSGRDEDVRGQTWKWLDANLNGCVPDQLMMRPHCDHCHDAVLKKRWLDEMRPEDRARLVAVFEDRKRVVDMWRENGVTCYQVAPGDF